MRNLWILPILIASLQAQTVVLAPQEKEFQDSLANVTLEGQSTREGKEGVFPDRYSILKIEKTGDDKWTFYVQIAYQGKEVTMPPPIDVKWAGDTPVITLTDKAFPGMGAYTARVVVYRGHYAGTWSGKNGGGKVFGKVIKKIAAEPGTTPASNGPCPLCTTPAPKPQ